MLMKGAICVTRITHALEFHGAVEGTYGQFLGVCHRMLLLVNPTVPQQTPVFGTRTSPQRRLLVVDYSEYIMNTVRTIQLLPVASLTYATKMGDAYVVPEHYTLNPVHLKPEAPSIVNGL